MDRAASVSDCLSPPAHRLARYTLSQRMKTHRFSVSDIFSTILQPRFFQWSRALLCQLSRANITKNSHRLATLHFSFCVADKPSYPYAGLAECARRVSINIKHIRFYFKGEGPNIKISLPCNNRVREKTNAFKIERRGVNKQYRSIVRIAFREKQLPLKLKGQGSNKQYRCVVRIALGESKCL